MSSKPREQASVAISDDGAADAPPITTNGNSNADDAFGDAYTRLADAVTVIKPSRNGTTNADAWSEGPAREEIEEEAEKEPTPLGEQEGLDDPVRMYLREIGKVHLLSGPDEKRIARQMEEAKHVAANERVFAAQHNRIPTGQETLLILIEQYHNAQKSVMFVCKELGVKASLVSDVIENDIWRSTVDAEMDFDLAARLAEHLGVEQADAERSLVRLSVITHILQPEHVRSQATLFGGEEMLLPPP